MEFLSVDFGRLREREAGGGRDHCKRRNCAEFVLSDTGDQNGWQGQKQMTAEKYFEVGRIGILLAGFLGITRVKKRIVVENQEQTTLLSLRYVFVSHATQYRGEIGLDREENNMVALVMNSTFFDPTCCVTY
jgi:hypothetical protein